MQNFSRRCVITGFSLLCLSSVGCLQVPYCLPELSYAPSVGARCKSNEVYAFRVDVTQKMEINGGAVASAMVRGTIVEQQELTRIRTSADGTTAAQMGLTFASGWRYVG